MSSTVKIEYLDVLTDLLNETRPADLPAQVADSENNLVDIHIIPEHNLDAEKNQRPAMIFIAEDGSPEHPELFSFELRLENIYNTDDFTKDQVGAWQKALVAQMSDRQFTIRAINLALCEKESEWYVRKVVVGAPGESGVEGQRSRGLSDSWTVWMMKE